MARVKGITGNKSPKTGESSIYEVIRDDNTTPEDYAKVSWQLYLKDEAGQWIKHPKSPKRVQKGAKQEYKFGELFTNQELLLTAYNEKPVLNEPPALKIKPIAGDPKITKLAFTDLTGVTLDKLSYSQKVFIQIHTVGMIGKYVNYSIYDEVNGTKTEVRKGQPKQVIKPNGVVNPEESFFIDMPIRTGQSTSASEHHYKIKVWDVHNEANFLEQDLKIKNQNAKQMSDPETLTPTKTGTSEPPKKKEVEKNKCERCIKLTKEELKAIFTAASDDTINKVLDAFNEGMKYFEINTCLRKAHFFAQALKEVGASFTIKVPESLNYRTDGLINGYWYSAGSDWVKGSIEKKQGGYFSKGTKKSTINFSYTKKHPEVAEKYGRKDFNKYGDGGVQRANSDMLANYIYANRLGNGNPESGDGSKYRGKGLIQLTGRSNYDSVNKEMQKFDSSLEDILKNPNKILTDIKLAVLSAMGFWKVNKINNVIGKDTSDTIVYKVTNIVNSGEDAPNKLKRYDNFKNITKKVFKVDECKNK